MPITPEEGADLLITHVNGSVADLAIAQRAWNTAAALVERFIGSSEVPEDVVTEATLQAGSEIWHKRQAPNGIQQFATADGVTATRVARDPMLAARPLLEPFVSLGMA